MIGTLYTGTNIDYELYISLLVVKLLWSFISNTVYKQTFCGQSIINQLKIYIYLTVLYYVHTHIMNICTQECKAMELV